jgi:hypothetical protein
VGDDEGSKEAGTEGAGLRVAALLERLNEDLRCGVGERHEKDGKADKDEGEVVDGRRRGVCGWGVRKYTDASNSPW